MKKLIFSIALTFLSLTIFPASVGENVNKETSTSVPAPKPAENAEAKVLIERLNKINSMDKSKLNSSEKKNLRKEVKSIRSKLKDISGGIYISGAALVVIVILLLLLL